MLKLLDASIEVVDMLFRVGGLGAAKPCGEVGICVEQRSL
jgi:hypothetical protein